MLETFEPQQEDHILGKTLMDEIRKDMQRSVLPTALNRAPLNWGTAGRGKLSGEQWHVLGIVHLPVTLIRIWGFTRSPPKPSDDSSAMEHQQYKRELDSQARFQMMLYNYIDLVKAVTLANNRTTSRAHADSYDFHLFRYFSGADRLYRALQSKPIQHVSGHFGEFLSELGPAHAYQTSGFERVNHQLQQIKTNGKVGQIEGTFLRRYSEAATLAGILASDPAMKQSAESLLGQYTKQRHRNSMASQMMREDLSLEDGVNGSEINLHDTALQALNAIFPDQRFVTEQWREYPRLILEGVKYAASLESRRSVPGSYVMLRHAVSTNPAIDRAALLCHIFKDNNGSLYVLYRLFNPAMELEVDQYRALEMGHLTSPDLEETLHITSAANIVCPCVATEMEIYGLKVLHILPYNRRRPSFEMKPQALLTVERVTDKRTSPEGEAEGEGAVEEELRPSKRRRID
ncbi:hypothetical protein V5O48_015500 [Marasmius crinis-equi]|uniref:Uncharacterized protein n=1 Tax=Marasmius crinis-equi TaxID=585013 RepID=A0ABR3EUE1_9AGAR